MFVYQYFSELSSLVLYKLRLFKNVLEGLNTFLQFSVFKTVLQLQFFLHLCVKSTDLHFFIITPSSFSVNISVRLVAQKREKK